MRSRSSSTTSCQRWAERTWRSACDPRIWPIGDASGGQPASARALTVETNRETARLADPLDELPGLRRFEGPGRVVNEDARSAELAQVVRALEQNFRLAGEP